MADGFERRLTDASAERRLLKLSRGPTVSPMLTDTQVQVLAAVNDHCESLGRMLIAPNVDPLPDLLLDLGLPTEELLTALTDLQELGLIIGVAVPEIRHPFLVDGLTAKGRQELP